MQRVAFSSSADAISWAAPVELFPHVSDAGTIAEPWIEIDDKLYAFASLGAETLDPDDVRSCCVDLLIMSF